MPRATRSHRATTATMATLASLLAAGCYAGAEEDDTDTEAGSSGAATTASAGSSPSSTSPGSGPSSTAGTNPSTTNAPSTTASTETTTSDDGSTTDAPPVDEPLLDRLEVFDVELPAGIKAGTSNWRIWGTGSLHVAPVFTVPREGCGTLLGVTTDAGGPSSVVVMVDADDAVVDTVVLGDGLELRGLAAEPDGHFGALLWDDAADRIWMRRFDPSGTEVWSTELTNPDNTPDDFGIGDSRLEFGDGRYGAYYHVHSDTGHEGDTLKWIAAASGEESTGWGWGCSHSMSNVLRYHPDADRFMPACVTDCFPGTSGDFATNAVGGIYLNHNEAHVIDVDAGCNGSVAGELGSAALAPNGWGLVFNAHQAPVTLGQNSYDPSTMNQDVAISMIGADLTPGAVVWLTDTAAIHEDDTSIARWTPAGGDGEEYVVGWHEPGGAEAWKLARMDATGAFLEGPIDVTAAAQWGRRDDPFRRDARGDVRWSWADDPGATVLHSARLRSGGTAACGD